MKPKMKSETVAMPESLFDSLFFIGNRQQLRKRVPPDAPIVLTANGLLQRNGDATFKFRQDSSFWYLTGIEEPDVLLVIDIDDEYLITTSRDEVRQAFDGVVETEVMAARSGIRAVFDEDAGWKRLRKSLKRSGKIATLMPAPQYIEQAGMYVNPARERLAERIASIDETIEMTDLRETLAAMRAVKQPQELVALQKAIDITIDGLETVTGRKALQGYNFEYQAEAELTRLFKLGGASGHAFEPIIAAGKRACTLHNLSMNGTISSDELLQFDVGAEYQHYAADISRVYAVGEPSQRQMAIHQAVCNIQHYALTLLKPGVLLHDYETKVAEFLGGKLVELGLIEAPADAAIRRYYPHAASHYLGLDVHDTGLYNQPLKAGMVVTCEPGIYVPEEAIGVRIEDDVLITDSGCVVLSKRLSRSLQ